MEFIDLYEIEPVMAKIRLDELSYTLEDHRDQSDADWNRAVNFGDSLSPTWMAHMYNQSAITTMFTTLKRFSEEDWMEIARISPNMAEAYHFLWDGNFEAT
jgi:hypothetical protein